MRTAAPVDLARSAHLRIGYNRAARLIEQMEQRDSYLPCIERQSRGAGTRESGITRRDGLAFRVHSGFPGSASHMCGVGRGASDLSVSPSSLPDPHARGQFEQKIFDRNLKLLQESRGELAFSRPGKFRWNYVKPYAQLIVGDGSRVWIYDEDLSRSP